MSSYDNFFDIDKDDADMAITTSKTISTETPEPPSTDESITGSGDNLVEMMEKSNKDQKALKEKHQILLHQLNNSKNEWSDDADVVDRIRALSSSSSATPPPPPQPQPQPLMLQTQALNTKLQNSHPLTPPKSSPYNKEKPVRPHTPNRPGTPVIPLEIPESDGTPKGDFKRKLYQFMIDVGQPITKVPHLGYQELDIYLLYNLVQERGGMDEVTRKQEWKLVYQDLGIPTMSTSASYNTRTNYKKYLYLYELDNAPQEQIEESLFKIGDYVRIVSDNMEGKVFYASVLRMKRSENATGNAGGGGGIVYYIHYNGWSSSHDEWMPEEVLENLLEDEMVRPEYLSNPPPNRSSKSNYIIDSDSNMSSGGGGNLSAGGTGNTPSPKRRRKEKKKITDNDDDDDDDNFLDFSFKPKTATATTTTSTASSSRSGKQREQVQVYQLQKSSPLTANFSNNPSRSSRGKCAFSSDLLIIENRKSENERLKDLRAIFRDFNDYDFDFDFGNSNNGNSGTDISNDGTDTGKDLTDGDSALEEIKTIPIREILNLSSNAIINEKCLSEMKDHFRFYKNTAIKTTDLLTAKTGKMIFDESLNNNKKKRPAATKDLHEEKCIKLLSKLEELQNPTFFLKSQQSQQQPQQLKTQTPSNTRKKLTLKKKDQNDESQTTTTTTTDLGDYRRLSSRRLK